MTVPETKVVAPTVGADGTEQHPAFAQISATRVSSTPGSVLFDSDIQHQHTVVISINTADRQRMLNRDWIHGRDEIVKIEVSEAQWASFVSSMNTSGVPCTLRSTENNRFIPELPYEPRLAHSMDEVKNATKKAFSKIEDAMAAFDALDPKAGAREKRDALRNLRNAIVTTESNLVYAANSMTEHAENVVQRARVDIESMVTAEADRRGLTGSQAQMLALPVFEGEVVEDESQS